MLKRMGVVLALATLSWGAKMAFDHPLEIKTVSQDVVPVTAGQSVCTQSGQVLNCANVAPERRRRIVVVAIEGERTITAECVQGGWVMHNDCRLFPPGTYMTHSYKDGFELLYPDGKKHGRFYTTGISQ